MLLSFYFTHRWHSLTIRQQTVAMSEQNNDWHSTVSFLVRSSPVFYNGTDSLNVLAGCA